MIKKIFPHDKIFIAGARGMAGSAIKRALTKYGYGLEQFKGKLLYPNSKELNLLNYLEVEKWFKKHKPSVVILSAAKVGGIYANNLKPADFILENLKIQTNVIETAWQNGVRRFLFLGSSCIYPKFAEQPIKEDSLLTSSLEPTNDAYAIAKIAGIKLCEALRKQYGFDAISIMPTNLYGPGDNYDNANSHVFAAFIRRFYNAKKNSLSKVTCWGSGLPFREFLHVDDLGDAAVFVLENWSPQDINAPKDCNGNPLNILNIGTGKDISIKELAYKIANAFEFKGEIIWDQTKPDGTPKKQLDVSKINELGWQSKISLEKGIESTIKLYCQEIIEGKIRI